MSKRTIYQVDRVTVAVSPGDNPQLSITARGRVPTADWNQPELIPHVYIRPPDDGILDFTFIAEPPDSFIPQVLQPIEATYTMERPPMSAQGIGTSPQGFGTSPLGVRGVRVHASINTQEVLIDQAPQDGKLFVKGTLTDEGVECQALKTESGELYTLVGDLKGFQVGETVYILGTVVPISVCMQGTTLAVEWISKDPPKCR